MLFCQQKANNPFNTLPNSEKKKRLVLCYLLRIFTENTGPLHENTGLLFFTQM